MKNYKSILIAGFCFLNHKGTKARSVTKALCCLVFFASSWFHAAAQRRDTIINNDWQFFTVDKISPAILTGESAWEKVNLPHNQDAYDGYRRLLHGNKHGSILYSKKINIQQPGKGQCAFLFFEGVSSYARVYINGKYAGQHAGGRTSFTIDITRFIKAGNVLNEIFVNVGHPANIQDLPWVCGGCSDERGFSEGSQPMGIFRPVHLIVTNDIRVVPFGVHAWATIQNKSAALSINTTIENYSATNRNITVINQLVDATGNVVKEVTLQKVLRAKDSITVLQNDIAVENPELWSVDDPYLYKIISIIKEKNIVIDKTETDFGFRTINWKTASHQFLLNDKPVFINGIAEYEHLLGGSHAFSNEEIIARMQWIQSAGFNAFRDAHQPHNLLYGKLCDEKGILWWTQFSAHIWYDTKAFRENFKTLLKEWVIERRNDPAVILWGLQNESKLPKDFAAECTAIIRSLDPTASSQRLITTCNGGEGTDWDVPQNWTGTYGGNPATYGNDLKKQVLVGEYGAWRTLDLHTEGGFVQNGPVSEDRMTLLMEQKIRLAESVRDSVAGQFFWLLTSHDNPGRVQGGEGLRELDRVGPVNYKGILTPWEEPTDAYYMFRSNYVPGKKDPMVYIVSHTWPNRWMQPGIKDSIIVYSNCDEVELFNDIDNASLGKRKKNDIGTHFQWDKADIRYNILYAVGYIDGKAVARDTITLFHLPQAPGFNNLYAGATNITKPVERPWVVYNYMYRLNCGGDIYVDENGNQWWPDTENLRSWTNDFPEIPKNFANQRRIFTPVKGTKDWKLFQSFRYGKKLGYNFKVKNGDYLVEFYFIEPWLGVGGTVDAAGMRLFDVTINNNVVIKDLDIWHEAGNNTILKKTVEVKVMDGILNIDFPPGKAGESVISAIAIAEINHEGIKIDVKRGAEMNAWLDIGDEVFAHNDIQFNSLPPELFGAYWVQLDSAKAVKELSYVSEGKTELFICMEDGYEDKQLLEGFTDKKSVIVTGQNGGTRYRVYSKRFADGEKKSFSVNGHLFVCMQPVNNMQPAYDLKPIASYRPDKAKLNGDGFARSTINEKETITFKQNKTSIDWNINIGAADIYSLNIRYANPADKNLTGTLQIIMADGTVMKHEKITFTPSKSGKWNYISTNSGSMINAGNYTIRIVADDAVGIGISGLDIQ